MNLMHIHKRFGKFLALACLLFVTGCSAVDFGSGGSGSQTCFTDQDNYQRLCKVEGSSITGFCIITKITNDIREMLQNAAGTLFEGIREALSLEVLSPVLMLSVAVYGVLVLMGMVQMNGWDAFVRVFKFGLVVTAFSPTGWDFFEEYVATFFRDGADDIIQQTSLLMIDKLVAVFGNAPQPTQDFLTQMHDAIQNYSYATQSNTAGQPSNPFLPIDVVLGLIISPKTLAILQAASSEGTVGWGFAYVAIYGMGVLFFIMAIAKCLWVYLLSLLATALLFGMFPFFILFILFQRTKGIFDGYIRLLTTFMIQPIFLFLFISLFVSIIAASLQDITTTLSVCNTCSMGDDFTCKWQFAITSGSGGEQIFCRSDPSGMVGYDATEGPCKQLSDDISKMFPNLLIFFLMAYICWNFVGFVTTLAVALTGGMDISGSTSFLHGLFSQGMGKLQSQISSNMFPKK